MEINIITTKTKLTPSLTSQMRFPSISVMEQGKVLGFLINVVPGCHHAILIQHADDYFIVAADYRHEGKDIFRKVDIGWQSKKFKSIDDCNNWWEAYLKVVKAASNHIYI